MTLGLADVSARVGLRSVAEAEKYIRDMVIGVARSVDLWALLVI